MIIIIIIIIDVADVTATVTAEQIVFIAILIVDGSKTLNPAIPASTKI